MVCTFEFGRILILVLHCYAVAVRELAERRRNGVALLCSVRRRVLLQLQAAVVVVEHSVVNGKGVAVAVEVNEVELALLVFVLIAEAVESALVGVEDHLCRVGSLAVCDGVRSRRTEIAFLWCECGCDGSLAESEERNGAGSGVYADSLLVVACVADRAFSVSRSDGSGLVGEALALAHDECLAVNVCAEGE